MKNPEFKTAQGKEAYERLMQVAEGNKQLMKDYQTSEDVAERIHILSMYFVAASDALKAAHEIDRQERMMAAQVTMIYQEMSKEQP